jgi:peptidyl-prolyl cis-trans isomerase A (cyclophilin A)
MRALVFALVGVLAAGCNTKELEDKNKKLDDDLKSCQANLKNANQAKQNLEKKLKDLSAPPPPAVNVDEVAKELGIKPNDKLYATFVTSMGTMTAELYWDKAPKTVENFVGLAEGTKEWTDPKGEKVKKPLYDGTIFHRVIPDFMIQGGDPLGNGTGGPGYKFEDETNNGLKLDDKGILAMANSGPNTNGSQFFITEKATPWLNGHHTVFGKVIEGVDLVPKITHVDKDPGDPSKSRPKEPITLKKVLIGRGQPKKA